MKDFQRAMLALQCRILRAVTKNAEEEPDILAVLEKLKAGDDSAVLELLDLEPEGHQEDTSSPLGPMEVATNRGTKMERIGQQSASKMRGMAENRDRNKKR